MNPAQSTAWKIAIRSLRRNRRRNLATGLAIAFGFSGLLLLGGYIVRVEKYMGVNSIYINHAGHVSIYKTDGLDKNLSQPEKYNLSAADQAALAGVLAPHSEKIEFTGRYLKTAGLAGNGCSTVPFFATGIEPEVENRIRHHPEVLEWTPELARLKHGQGMWEVEPGRRSDTILVTSSLARLLGKPKTLAESAPVSATISVPDCTSIEGLERLRQDSNLQLAGRTFIGDFSAVDADVSGHFSTGLSMTEDTGLVAPLSLLQKLHDTEAITYLAVFFRNPEDSAGKFASDLNQEFTRKNLPFTAYSFDDERISLFYVGALQFLMTMEGFFVILVFGVVILSIVNSITMSTIERTREIGTLRSMGFTPQFVTGLFARESLILTLISLAGGGVLTAVSAKVINALNIRFYPPGIADDFQFMLIPTPLLGVGLAIPIAFVAIVTARVASSRRARTKVFDLLTATTT